MMISKPDVVLTRKMGRDHKLPPKKGGPLLTARPSGVGEKNELITKSGCKMSCRSARQFLRNCELFHLPETGVISAAHMQVVYITTVGVLTATPQKKYTDVRAHVGMRIYCAG